MKHYPVIIIGSGPAGSACAKALKDGGIGCLVLEKRKLPRDKTCSGVVYGQLQELLLKYFGKEVPKEVRCKPEIINANNVQEWKPDNTLVKYTWELPKDGKPFSENWINVWRPKFDFWLLQESGAEYRESTRFLGFKRNGTQFEVEVKLPDGSKETLSCDYLVGADGAASVVRRAHDPEGAKKAKTCVGNYAYYKYTDTGKIKDGHWYSFFRPEFGQIIACIHHKDDLLAMSVGGFLGAKLDEYEKNFVKFLSETCGVKFGERVRCTGCMMKMAPPFLGEGNLLFAGDAAGLIYLNGEGMSCAVDSGYRAGQAIVGAIKDKIPNPAETYTKNAEDILRHMQLCLDNMHFLV